MKVAQKSAAHIHWYLKGYEDGIKGQCRQNLHIPRVFEKEYESGYRKGRRLYKKRGGL